MKFCVWNDAESNKPAAAHSAAAALRRGAEQRLPEGEMARRLRFSPTHPAQHIASSARGRVDPRADHRVHHCDGRDRNDNPREHMVLLSLLLVPRGHRRGVPVPVPVHPLLQLSPVARARAARGLALGLPLSGRDAAGTLPAALEPRAAAMIIERHTHTKKKL